MTPLASLRHAVAVFAAVAVWLVASIARAQPPDVQVQSDADVVGLGDVIHVTLQATSYGGQPVDPQLGANANFAIVSLTPSTSTQMTLANGTMTTQRVLTAVWTLKATKVGNAAVGPFTIKVDNTRYKTGALRVRVVPAGQAPPRPVQRSPFGSPFGGLDPFANFFNNPFGQLPQLQAPQEPEPSIETRKDLALDAPRGSNVFLHATVDKTSAVVGEQVTYTCYVYYDVNARSLDLTDPHEATTSDFVRHSLRADDGKLADVAYARAGDRIYKVELIRKVALFPLATGDLSIGAMRVQVGSQASNIRTSEEFTVHVTEPPVAGRPPGYVVGDVGQFDLETEVTGRDVEREGAIGVNVTVRGTGNVPASITPPERAGVEWLDPQTNETLGPQTTAKLGSTNDAPAPDDPVPWGGSRTFHYVVRLHRAGEVDLGDFTVPYWNPTAKPPKYEVARIHLGTIHVKPGSAGAGASTADAPIDPLPGLPALRPSLAGSGAVAARAHLDDSPAFWFALGAMPLAYFGVTGAARAVRGARERRAEKAASPREELRARMAAADAASQGTEAGRIDAATMRVLETATIALRGVNVRALASSEIARALTTAGAPEDDARAIEELLRACEASRYSAGDVDPGGARERWARARSVVERLSRGA